MKSLSLLSFLVVCVSVVGLLSGLLAENVYALEASPKGKNARNTQRNSVRLGATLAPVYGAGMNQLLLGK